ncbi:SH3 domain containing protein [Thiorhodovibrio winogradskyi]|uniref:SH3 domain containing protein n=1 Tax=Thiorhodovibrio winogradskyi TaxID=77007 RepID=A0ABZ0SEL8_9GAMM
MQFAQAKARSVRFLVVSAAVFLLVAGSMMILPGSANAAVPFRATTDLNVRACPSTNCAVIGVLRRGSCHAAQAWVKDRTWLRINFRGRRGFVSGRYARRGC